MQILFVAGLLLGANWLLFIWAINNDHILDASLGYYINPLINVFLGRLFLGERLRNLQRVAVGLAVIGVAILIFSYGHVPWIALVLAGSFSVYGLLRKQVAVVKMTDPDSAGSIFSLSNITGTNTPASAAATMLNSMAKQITNPNMASVNQK